MMQNSAISNVWVTTSFNICAHYKTGWVSYKHTHHITNNATTWSINNLIYGYESLTGRRSKCTANKIKSDEAAKKSNPLTCAAFTGGSLRTSAWAQIPVDRCLRRGQHPIVTEGGCSCCQGLAAQSCTWLVHGIGIGYWHSHVHGEVLLGQCCRL